MTMPQLRKILASAAICLAAAGMDSCQPNYHPREIENPHRICVMRGADECLTLTLGEANLRKLGTAISLSGTRVTNRGRSVGVRPANEEYYSEYRLQVFGENENRSASLYTIFPFEVSGCHRELSDETAGYSFRLDFRPMLSSSDEESLYRLIPEWRNQKVCPGNSKLHLQDKDAALSGKRQYRGDIPTP